MLELIHCSQDSIEDLHFQVFGEMLSESRIQEKTAQGALSFLKVTENRGTELLGYAILQDRSPLCHIWLLGILRKYRGKGYGKDLLDALENKARHEGFTRMSLSTFNARREMLALAVKKGYQIIAVEPEHHSENVKIRLEKKLKEKRELRVLLTSHCNYHCIFCHSEGIEHQNPLPQSVEQVFRTIVDAVNLDYDDITFTGGEPLLKKDALVTLLSRLNLEFQDKPPSITLVTNGSLIDNSFIEQISSYPGHLKVHVSLHSFDPCMYEKVTGDHDNFPKVLENLARLVEKNVTVKVNVVLLRNLNSTREAILKIIDKSHALGIHTVKFLELLVTRDKEKNYHYFLSAEEAENILSNLGFAMVRKNQRGALFTHEDRPGLIVEVYKLTCKLGCAVCPSVRDRTIGPDLCYYPCFVHSDEHFSLTAPLSCADAFERGDLLLRHYGEAFGKDSPILIAQESYVKKQEDLYFEISLTFEECREILVDSGFEHRKNRDFTLFYCRPKSPSEQWLTYQKQLKFGFDAPTPYKVAFIYSTHEYKENSGYFVSCQTFLDNSEPPQCKGIDKARSIIEALDFVEYFSREFSICDFCRDDTTVSLDRSSMKVNMKISTRSMENHLICEVLEKLGAENIRIPFTRWLIENNSPVVR